MTTTLATPVTEPLEEERRERVAALGGVLFVVLGVVSNFLPGTPPASDASAGKVAAYFHDHAGAIKAQQFVGALGIVALLWWFGALWRMLSRAEGERPRVAVVAAVSLASGVTLAIFTGVITATAAVRLENIETTHLLWTLSLVSIAGAGFGIGAFLIATCTVTYRSALTPRWTSYLGWVAGLAFIVGTLGWVTDANAVNVFNLIAFFAWCVWILAVSAVLWRRRA